MIRFKKFVGTVAAVCLIGIHPVQAVAAIPVVPGISDDSSRVIQSGRVPIAGRSRGTVVFTEPGSAGISVNMPTSPLPGLGDARLAPPKPGGSGQGTPELDGGGLAPPKPDGSGQGTPELDGGGLAPPKPGGSGQGTPELNGGGLAPPKPNGSGQGVPKPDSGGLAPPKPDGSGQGTPELDGGGLAPPKPNGTDQGSKGPGDSGVEAPVLPSQMEGQPEIQSESAVVMDAASGNILFNKNGDKRHYPASITKLMTAMLVLENSSLDDMVTYSASATANLEAGAVSLNLVEGDKLTVRQSLYALLLKSANEVANGLAEHVAGSNEAFAKMMNDRAVALGCTDTNFVNPHGLNDSSHYTTARDMALIAQAAFQNETLRTIDTTLSYQLPDTIKGDAKTITMGHKMMYSTDSRYYPDIIGGKTGYTSLAGNTLVTAAERDGVRLIVVVLKSKNTHYADTKALLDYGFSVMTGWQQDDVGWYYIKPDGSRALNQWQKIDGINYWFDSNAYMATGWRQFQGGLWYYFKDSGAMAVNYWVQNQNQWFYLGSDGVMMTNAVTPDGFHVNEYGVWTK